MPASASGLRSSPCSTAPERPRLAPISIASRVRGTRNCQTMTSRTLASPPSKECATSAGGIATLPAKRDAMAAASSSVESTAGTSQPGRPGRAPRGEAACARPAAAVMIRSRR